MGIRNYFERRKERIEREILAEERYDDNGKTNWERIKGRIKKDAQFTKMLSYPLLYASALFGIGLLNNNVLEQQVTPLGWHDFDADGKRDPIVAFPIAGTKKAVLGYISRERMPDNYRDGPLGPVPFDTNAVFLHPFPNTKLIHYTFNRSSTQFSGNHAIIRDYDGDGKLDLNLWARNFNHANVTQFENILGN